MVVQPQEASPDWQSSGSAGPHGSPLVVMGRTEPRIWTPPLRELTPSTSYGFDVIEFARDTLLAPLDPWQEWLVIHAGELLPDGRPRFRTVLVLVSRQQGKTFLLQVLTLYWLFLEHRRFVLGTSTNLDYAKEAWLGAVELAQSTEDTAEEIAPNGVRTANGQECLTVLVRNSDGRVVGTCRYKIAASNRRGGRSLTIDRLVLDELREHHTWDAWNAATNAQNAVIDGQCFAITNQGDDMSVVLDALREPALEYLENGQGDWRLGIFEWSSPNGSDPTDLEALAYANPNLGRRTDADTLLGAGIRAKRAGGEQLAGFRTEAMCMRVHLTDPAIDPDRWDSSGTDTPVDLAEHRKLVALCVDISLDGSHASLVAAAVIEGQVHVEVVEAWEGYGCTARLRAELPGIVMRVKPRVIGWFPKGPAAAVAAELADPRRPRRGAKWPPPRVKVVELKAEVTAVCMGLAELVFAGELVHPNDALLTAHTRAAQKLKRGEAWAFTRLESGPIDGAYALAGAVHLARTLPPPRAAVASG